MTHDPYTEARTLFDQYIKPLLYEIAGAQGEEDAEYFAGSIVYHLRGELGWSVAYYTKADALHYWCLARDYDEDELTADQRTEFGDFWSTWRHSKAWDDALWLDEYTGDSIVDLIEWHIKESKEKGQ
jgi:hypothetical protein